MKPFTIHYAGDANCRVPYPHHIDADQRVGSQDFWKGDPWAFLGLQRGTSQSVEVRLEDITPETDLENLFAVFSRTGGNMYAYMVPIARIEFH